MQTDLGSSNFRDDHTMYNVTENGEVLLKDLIGAMVDHKNDGHAGVAIAEVGRAATPPPAPTPAAAPTSSLGFGFSRFLGLTPHSLSASRAAAVPATGSSAAAPSTTSQPLSVSSSTASIATAAASHSALSSSSDHHTISAIGASSSSSSSALPAASSYTSSALADVTAYKLHASLSSIYDPGMIASLGPLPIGGGGVSCCINTTENKDDASGRYTLYVVTVTVGPKQWTLSRRYREFRALHVCLNAAASPLTPEERSQLPKLPPKKYIGSMAPAFIEERRKQLETYVQAVVAIPGVWSIPDVIPFLEDPVSGSSLAAHIAMARMAARIETLEHAYDEAQVRIAGYEEMVGQEREGNASLRQRIAELEREVHAQLLQSGGVALSSASLSLTTSVPFPHFPSSIASDELLSSPSALAASISHLIPANPSHVPSELDVRLDALLVAMQPNSDTDKARSRISQFTTTLLKRALGAQVFPVGSVPSRTYLDFDPVAVCAYLCLGQDRTWFTKVSEVLFTASESGNGNFSGGSSSSSLGDPTDGASSGHFGFGVDGDLDDDAGDGDVGPIVDLEGETAGPAPSSRSTLFGGVGRGDLGIRAFSDASDRLAALPASVLARLASTGSSVSCSSVSPSRANGRRAASLSQLNSASKHATAASSDDADSPARRLSSVTWDQCVTVVDGKDGSSATAALITDAGASSSSLNGMGVSTCAVGVDEAGEPRRGASFTTRSRQGSNVSIASRATARSEGGTPLCRVRSVSFISGRHRRIVTDVDGMPVAVTANQMAELCQTALVEEADANIGHNHLFKRSLLLIRAWATLDAGTHVAASSMASAFSAAMPSTSQPGADSKGASASSSSAAPAQWSGSHLGSLLSGMGPTAAMSAASAAANAATTACGAQLPSILAALPWRTWVYLLLWVFVRRKSVIHHPFQALCWLLSDLHAFPWDTHALAIHGAIPLDEVNAANATADVSVASTGRTGDPGSGRSSAPSTRQSGGQGRSSMSVSFAAVATGASSSGSMAFPSGPASRGNAADSDVDAVSQSVLAAVDGFEAASAAATPSDLPSPVDNSRPRRSMSSSAAAAAAGRQDRDAHSVKGVFWPYHVPASLFAHHAAAGGGGMASAGPCGYDASQRVPDEVVFAVVSELSLKTYRKKCCARRRGPATPAASGAVTASVSAPRSSNASDLESVITSGPPLPPAIPSGLASTLTASRAVKIFRPLCVLDVLDPLSNAADGLSGSEQARFRSAVAASARSLHTMLLYVNAATNSAAAASDCGASAAAAVSATGSCTDNSLSDSEAELVSTAARPGIASIADRQYHHHAPVLDPTSIPGALALRHVDAFFKGCWAHYVPDSSFGHDAGAGFNGSPSSASFRASVTSSARFQFIARVRSMAADAAAVSDNDDGITGSFSSALAPVSVASSGIFDVLEGDLPSITRSIEYCSFLLDSEVTAPALLSLASEILSSRGPLPVGEVGKVLQDATSNTNLSAVLKEKFGGLKRFLEAYPGVFTLGNDHPFNPHVYRTPALTKAQKENLAAGRSIDGGQAAIADQQGGGGVGTSKAASGAGMAVDSIAATPDAGKPSAAAASSSKKPGRGKKKGNAAATTAQGAVDGSNVAGTIADAYAITHPVAASDATSSAQLTAGSAPFFPSQVQQQVSAAAALQSALLQQQRPSAKAAGQARLVDDFAALQSTEAMQSATMPGYAGYQSNGHYNNQQQQYQSQVLPSQQPAWKQQVQQQQQQQQSQAHRSAGGMPSRTTGPMRQSPAAASAVSLPLNHHHAAIADDVYSTAGMLASGSAAAGGGDPYSRLSAAAAAHARAQQTAAAAADSSYANELALLAEHQHQQQQVMAAAAAARRRLMEDRPHQDFGFNGNQQRILGMSQQLQQSSALSSFGGMHQQHPPRLAEPTGFSVRPMDMYQASAQASGGQGYDGSARAQAMYREEQQHLAAMRQQQQHQARLSAAQRQWDATQPGTPSAYNNSVSAEQHRSLGSSALAGFERGGGGVGGISSGHQPPLMLPSLAELGIGAGGSNQAPLASGTQASSALAGGATNQQQQQRQVSSEAAYATAASSGAFDDFASSLSANGASRNDVAGGGGGTGLLPMPTSLSFAAGGVGGQSGGPSMRPPPGLGHPTASSNAAYSGLLGQLGL